MFYVLIGFLAIQRISELFLAKKNEIDALIAGGYERGKSQYYFFIALHILFFVALICEYLISNQPLFQGWFVALLLLLLAQCLRYWAIFSLGKHWNTKIIILPSHQHIKKGPYRWMKHPNYLAVFIEFIAIPLIFQLWFTLIIFSIANSILLFYRIQIEEKALNLK